MKENGVYKICTTRRLLTGNDLLGVVDDHPAQVAQSVAAEERISGVNVAHVIHETERHVGFDVAGRFQPSGSLGVEAPDLIVAGLSATVEVLASEFSDPNWLLESVVPEFDVGLEFFEGSIIPMNGNNVECAPSVTSLQHVLDPSQTVGSRGGSRADEGVALGLQRLNVSLPQVGTVFRAHVGLTGLVRFVHAHDVGGISLNDVLNERVDLSVTPELRNRGEAQLLGQRGESRSPSVQESLLSAGGLEQAETLVRAHSPGKTKLGSRASTAVVIVVVSRTASSGRG
jgi:hypothetical protein